MSAEEIWKKIEAIDVPPVKKAAIAYSGGLDSSLGIELLRRKYKAEEIEHNKGNTCLLKSKKTCGKQYYCFNELNLSAYCRTAHTKEEWLQVSGETERGELSRGCICSASTPEGRAFFAHHSR